MSFRIVRADERRKKARVSSVSEEAVEVLGPDHAMGVEKQAYAEGYKEGERIGKEMGERIVAAAAQRYDRAVQEITSLHRKLRESTERDAVELAMAVARRIVQREVSIDPDLVAALVTVALKRVQGQSGLVARVSGSDFERVQAMLSSSNSNVVVKEDPSLERGDFMLDTNQTHVDGRIASQIDTIGRALLDG